MGEASGTAAPHGAPDSAHGLGRDFTNMLRPIDFADLFGTTPDRLPDSCLARIAAGNWAYTPLTGAARDAVIVDLLARIDAGALTRVVDGDKSRWLAGWAENLAAFRDQDGAIAALWPKYLRPGLPLRLYRRFVRPADPQFERNWYAVFRDWFFRTQLAGFAAIYEFGCGSGFNVAELARLYPGTTIHGLDWAEPSVEIVADLRRRHGLDTHGRLFDFFHPDHSLELPANSAVLTIGALEQTGTAFQPFLDFLLAKRPRCCFHIEPIYEWYDPADLVDYTAQRAHAARNFWRGFPQALARLEAAGEIVIHRTKRAHFGSLVLEGFSQLIWSPRRDR
jgi:SAM-dependent methyltransferase